MLLVGLLVLGLVEIADASLRTLDTSTFRLSDDYTLANYRRALTQPLFLVVSRRSLVGALIVTAVTLVFAFPYAYLMVRTRSPHSASSCSSRCSCRSSSARSCVPMAG